MLPKVLYPCPKTVSVRMANAMRDIVNLEYRIVTKKENKMPRSDAPVVCETLSGVNGFWCLECNDPELPEHTLNEIVANIRKWEGAPADPNNA